MKSITAKSILYCFKLMLKSGKLAFVGHLIVSTIIGLYSLIGINILKIVIDLLSAEQRIPGKIYVYVAMYVLSLVLIQVLNSLKKILWDYTFDKARNAFKCSVYEKVISMPMEYIDSNDGRDEIDDIVWMEDQVADYAYQIWDTLSVFIRFAIVCVSLFTYNFRYTMLALAVIIPSIIGRVIFERKSDKFRRQKAPDARKIRYYRRLLTESEAAKDIRMYNLSEPMKARYEEEKCRYLKSYQKLDKKRFSVLILTEALKYGGEVFFCVIAVILSVRGKLTIGDMTLYVGYIGIATSSFEQLLGFVMNIAFNFNKQMERVLEFFGRSGGLEEQKGIRNLDDFQSLEFDNVYFKYPTSDEYVLKGVSFAINKGDKISLVGINGAGKSTIIKIMLGLYKIESGTMRINSYPMSEYSIADIRKLYSVMFQSFAHYSFTLRENIGLSDIENMNDSDRINRVMEESGVSEFYDKFHKGLDTYLTKRFSDDGVELSKGQYQKVALGRTYFKDAQVVIFDEPSASLDAETEDRVFKTYEKISRDKTCIMISHRIANSRKASKIIVLDKGIIAEYGTHEELVKIQDGIYSNLYTLQQNKYVKQVEIPK